MAANVACSPYADDALGPIVHGCRGNFDFTLTFEQCFFAIAPAAAMLLLGSTRLYVLQLRREKRIQSNIFRWTKVAAIAVLSALQLALVVLWATTTTLPARSYGITAAVLSFSTSLLMAQLSPLEHTRSLRPSSVLGAYLFFTMLFDAAILRTIWLSPSFSARVRAVATSAYCFKGAILILEAKEKKQYLVAEQESSPSPEEFSGPYATSLLWWLNGLIWSGFKKILKPTDLFPINQGLRAELLSQRFRSKWQVSPTQGKNTLLLTITRVLGPRFLLPAIPRLALLALSFCQPLLLRSFLQYLNDETADLRLGYAYIGAYGVVYIGIAITSSLYWQEVYKSLTMLRGTLITAIYNKTMSIDIATRGKNAKEVTLMGTDVEQIVQGIRGLHDLWANALQIALATWLLKIELGAACAGPVAVTFLALGATIYSSTFTAKRQKGWMGAIEKRINTTSSLLASMKSVKMTGIASKVYGIIESLRVNEIKAARSFYMLAVYASTIALVPQLMSPVATFGIFTAQDVSKGATLNTTRLFTSLSLLILLTQPLFFLFEGVSRFASALGCLSRVQDYLLKGQWQDDRVLIPRAATSNATEKLDPTSNADALCIIDGRFAWSAAHEFSLSGITCRLQKSQQLYIVGPVASGKSTLLRALLGELPIMSGTVNIFDKSIAYCDQTPWISNGTIKDNIIGQSLFDARHYKLAVKACALEPDLKELTDGDQTKVGSRGIALSSGQKHRIALARAVYSRKQIMLFDGVFSQLDTNVQATIFANLFGPSGLFRQWGTTVVLTTHEVQFLPFADQIVCLNSTGQQSESGTFEQLKNAGGYVESLVQSGRIDSTVSLPLPDLRVESSPQGTGTVPRDNEKETEEPEATQNKSRQLGDWSTYRYYAASLGWWFGLVFMFLQISYAFFTVFPVVWLERWSHANTKHPNHQEDSRYLGGYAGFQVAAMLSAGTLTWYSFIVMARKAGLHLHTQMLTSVIRAPMSLFQKSDAGAILTRFSQDFQFIDSRLPLAIMSVVTQLFTCLGEAGLVASASVWILISYPLLIVAVFFIQQYYLRTSRQLRFLDLEEKAPLYTQFLETLEGLSTVRAFGWQHSYVQHNHMLVDNAQKPFYLLYMIQQWLALVLDLLIAALAVLVVGIIVALRRDVSVGFSGVSLTQIMGLTGYIKLLIQFWTSMETSLGAVSRVKQFVGETPNEGGSGEQSRAPESWPAKGEVVLNDVSAIYRGEKSDHTALHNVTMHIKPGEKVGICGRTGSGKTSLMLSLFSMIELSNGSISIDGIDLSTLQKDDIRARINGVPDDPFYFPGSIRANLNIEGNATDEQSREALVQFGLDEALLGAQGGLDAEFKPEELSQGQKQKFALARAMLRPCGKLVILDEATSKTDRDTDTAMQLAIGKVFADCTVIAIVHRLSNVLNWDRIAVLDQGRLVEFDSPQRLLAQEGSVFKRLYEGHQQDRDL